MYLRVRVSLKLFKRWFRLVKRLRQCPWSSFFQVSYWRSTYNGCINKTQLINTKLKQLQSHLNPFGTLHSLLEWLRSCLWSLIYLASYQTYIKLALNLVMNITWYQSVQLMTNRNQRVLKGPPPFTLHERFRCTEEEPIMLEAWIGRQRSRLSQCHNIRCRMSRWKFSTSRLGNDRRPEERLERNQRRKNDEQNWHLSRLVFDQAYGEKG